MPYLPLLLTSTSLVQGAVLPRQNEANPSASFNLADGFLNLFGRVRGGNGQTVTVTVTAPASTVTVFPDNANGAIGTATDISVSATAIPGGVPVVIPTGGVGVILIPLPSDAIRTSLVQNPPATTTSETVISATETSTDTLATSTDTAVTSSEGSTLAPLPTDTTATVTDSATSLQPLPTETTTSETDSSTLTSTTESATTTTETPTSPPIVEAPVSETTSLSSTSTLEPLPGGGSSLTTTIAVDSTSTANLAVPTAILNPGGAFGGVVGLIPSQSAGTPVAEAPASATTPAIANGGVAAPVPTIDVSTLTLSSQLNLGNLVQPTASPAA